MISHLLGKMLNGSTKKPKSDFTLKEISPSIGAISTTSNGGITTPTDLVETNLFLFVNIVKAKGLPGIKSYVEVKVGSFKMTTVSITRNSNPEWNQVFALEKSRIEDPSLEIVVIDRIKRNRHDEIVGRVVVAVSDIPTRVPTDSSLAPQWYELEDQNGRRRRRRKMVIVGELMLSTWIGTQADEVFPEAWHLDAASVSLNNIVNTRSQVYLSPRIWILRINVVQAENLLFDKDITEGSEIFVQVTIFGSLSFRTNVVNNNEGNPQWSEDLFIAVSEPLDQKLIVNVMQGTFKNHKILGKCVIPVKNGEKSLDGGSASAKWYDLEIPKINNEVEKNKSKVAASAGRLSMRLSLDGGYHIFDEDPHFSSDVNATAKKLWRPSIGVFEMGILNASGLPAMKNGSRTDAYCVAKYGPKWVRTRTIVDSVSPKWNEQFSWDVYDPCTFVTIAVFDNCHLQEVINGVAMKDARIGKVRINLSEMMTDKVYTYSFPLSQLQPSGLKKMGELQLAFRFCCPSMMNLLKVYQLPMLPRLHFTKPLSNTQLGGLRKQSVMLISSRMRQYEPSLRREVVSYVLESHESAWSTRRGRADFDRVKVFTSEVSALYSQYKKICSWNKPIETLLVHMALFGLILQPQVILPGIFIWAILDILNQYPKSPRHLSHVNLQMSHVDTTSVDELEEEFDPIPSRFEDNVIRQRYDRLRIIVGRIVEEMGNFATRLEKIQSFFTWQDPTATLVFMILCVIIGMVPLLVPSQVIICIVLVYLLRHPRFRSPLPSILENWVRRMPSKLDSMI